MELSYLYIRYLLAFYLIETKMRRMLTIGWKLLRSLFFDVLTLERPYGSFLTHSTL